MFLALNTCGDDAENNFFVDCITFHSSVQRTQVLRRCRFYVVVEAVVSIRKVLCGCAAYSANLYMLLNY